MKPALVLLAAVALQACAVLPNKPALRAAVIGVGSAIVIGAAAHHDNPAQPDVRLPRDPCANPEVCR